MAKIGLKNFYYGILSEAADGTPSYGVKKKLAKAVSCNVDIANNDAKLYADDGLAEADTTFQSGTITLTIDDDDDTVMADLLGHSIEGGVMVRSASDVAPYVGFGRIITKLVSGVYKYKVEFLFKCKFSESSQSNETKGESVSFGTTELPGIVAQLANGNWSATKTFNTMADAETYLDSLFGAATAATVTYNANGGSNAPAAVTTYVGAIINVDDGSGLTPPSSKHFVGWDTNSSATIPDIIDTYKVPAASVTLYAIYESN